jgi:phage-related protein
MGVEFLEMSSRKCPVSDFLENIKDVKAHTKILKDLEKIEDYPIGMLLKAGFLKKMPGYEKYKLYEYALLYNKIQYRILCCLPGNEMIYLVHAFIKKEQKTRLSHLQTAISRINSFILPII